MNYDFKILKQKVTEIQDWLAKEFANIRTGTASPAILDNVFVEAYGQKMPLNQVATISKEDARVIRIAPWDKSQSKAIEKALLVANLGVSVQVDDKGVRIFFPELTSERRSEIAKLAKAKLEDAKVSLRAVREEVWQDIQEKEKAGGVGEDDKFRWKDEMQKNIDEGVKYLEKMLEKKEQEINS